MSETTDNGVLKGVEHAGVIDVMQHDPATNTLTLTMVAQWVWDDSDEQMFLLQEKFNAYLSFLLDGECEETYPELSGAKHVVRLDTYHPPTPMVVGFLRSVRDQISFQNIALEVRSAKLPEQTPKTGGCGEGCGCHG